MKMERGKNEYESRPVILCAHSSSRASSYDILFPFKKIKMHQKTLTLYFLGLLPPWDISNPIFLRVIATLGHQSQIGSAGGGLNVHLHIGTHPPLASKS